MTQGANYHGTSITSNTTTTILSSIGNQSSPASEGLLHTVSIGTDANAGSVVIYDNSSASGNPIANLTTPAGGQAACAILDIQLLSGLTVVTSGFAAPKVVVVWR